MDLYKHAHLNKKQEKIYLYAYFETVAFIIYGNAPRDELGKELNTWINCVKNTKLSNWISLLNWNFSEHLDKSAAYVLYNKVSPVVCADHLKNTDTKVRVLKLFDYNDWRKWSIKDKSVYISGYLDTVASFQIILKEQGEENDLRDLEIVIEAIGIDGILSEVVKTKFKKQHPLPWSISRGLGNARKQVMSKK